MTFTFIRSAPPMFIGLVAGAALGSCTSGTCPLTFTWWRGTIYGGMLGTIVAWGNKTN